MLLCPIEAGVGDGDARLLQYRVGSTLRRARLVCPGPRLGAAGPRFRQAAGVALEFGEQCGPPYEVALDLVEGADLTRQPGTRLRVGGRARRALFGCSY